jgi:hypothetical protein
MHFGNWFFFTFFCCVSRLVIHRKHIFLFWLITNIRQNIIRQSISKHSNSYHPGIPYTYTSTLKQVIMVYFVFRLPAVAIYTKNREKNLIFKKFLRICFLFLAGHVKHSFRPNIWPEPFSLDHYPSVVLHLAQLDPLSPFLQSHAVKSCYSALICQPCHFETFGLRRVRVSFL